MGLRALPPPDRRGSAGCYDLTDFHAGARSTSFFAAP
jgi:hypothetical protein